MFKRLSNVDTARVVELIEVCSIIGEGIDESDPVRRLLEWYTLEGELVARTDGGSLGLFEKEEDDDQERVRT